jgi:hypothetical protein
VVLNIDFPLSTRLKLFGQSVDDYAENVQIANYYENAS